MQKFLRESTNLQKVHGGNLVKFAKNHMIIIIYMFTCISLIMLIPKFILDDSKKNISKRDNKDLKEILDLSENELIEKILDQAIPEYNGFYNMELTRDDIKINLFKDRKLFNHAIGKEKTENWIRAHAWGNTIYMFDFDSLEEATQGYHKKDIGNYVRCLKHEIAHCFYWYFLKGKGIPLYRLNEGMSIYLSGQLSEYKVPEKFEYFLNYGRGIGKGTYQESGFFVKLLVENFGKERFFELITSLQYLNTKEGFFKKFKEIFGFDLDYDTINTIYNEKKSSTQEESL